MRDRGSFGHILETLTPGPAPSRDEGFANPLARAAAPIASAGAEDPGVENLWDHAFAWVTDSPPSDEPPEPRPAPRAALPTLADDVEAIAAELGLAEASTRDELHRARRRFMWRNHPDRSADIPADLANRRAAIANRLVDHALGDLSEPKSVTARPGRKSSSG
jgi:hypothetical protein